MDKTILELARTTIERKVVIMNDAKTLALACINAEIDELTDLRGDADIDHHVHGIRRQIYLLIYSKMISFEEGAALEDGMLLARKSVRC